MFNSSKSSALLYALLQSEIIIDINVNVSDESISVRLRKLHCLLQQLF